MWLKLILLFPVRWEDCTRVQEDLESLSALSLSEPYQAAYRPFIVSLFIFFSLFLF